MKDRNVPRSLLQLPTGQTTTGNPFANKIISGAQISHDASHALPKTKTGKHVDYQTRLSYCALPERGVTVHSGDMGYTIGPFAGSARCPGRCVNLWMNG